MIYLNYCIKRRGLLLLLTLLPLLAFSQTINIKGLVKDATGEPIIGANVVEKGTTNGSITDFDGAFTLTINSNATLTVSYIGYQTKEIPMDGRTSFNIILEEDSKMLEDVVVIGYGTQRKEAVTGSVASMRGDDLRAVQTGNISSALQGRVAGVDMSQTSSKPGASMQIRIRGTRSLNASNDPLVVLDGIPFAGSLSDINPNDIKSLDILKDASSTAIYGSRGSNGVIMVTTNKGYTEQKAQVTYNGYYGIRIAEEYPMMNGQEFATLRKLAGEYSSNGIDESDDVSTNWQDLFYRTGITTSHDVGVSGGGKTNNYSFGLGYYHDQGVVPTQQYNRISLRGSLDQEVGSHIKLGFVTNSTYSLTEGGNIGLYGTLSLSPLANPKNEDGSWKRTVRMINDEQYIYPREVLEGLEDLWVQEDKAFGSYNTVYGEVKIPGIEGLKYRINLGLNFRYGNGGAFRGQGINEINPNTTSSASISNSLTTNWTVENLLTYDRSFGKHRINVVGMYSAEQTTYNKSAVAARDIPAGYFQYYNLGHAAGEITVNPSNQAYEQSGLISWMGRAMYSYDDRYMASVAFRTDASSRLAPGHKWHTYPAVSLGWNISKEAFWEDFLPTADQLKLRVGYGETSNQSVAPYKTLGLLATRPYNFGEAYDTGFYVSELPNTNLGWEYSSTYNFGLDFSLLNNRIGGTVEYYIQNTKDVLLSVSLPQTAGVGSYMANIGETQNKGFEISLNGVILDNVNGWTWDAGINLYSNRNKLIALASSNNDENDEDGRDESNWWFVGHPIDVIYDYEKIGLWQESEEAARAIAEPGGNAGMIKVKYTGEYDANGLPTRAIGPDDRQIISLEPNFQGGFNTRVAYRNFDLGIVGAYKSGGTLISTLYSSTGYLNMLTGRRGNVKADYWTPDNPDALFPKPGGVKSGDNPKYGSTLGYFDASYLKIRTITLGYNVPKEWLKRYAISNLRLYATVQNPFVFFSPYYNESGSDPEPNSYGDENQAVTTSLKSRLLIIGTNSPNTTNYLVGLNLTF